MSVFFSAILSDLTSRSVSFLIDKCLTMTAPAPAVEETLNSLQRLLIRAHVIVEESQDRIVTNQAMLRQLNRLQKEMYRGYHTLDTLRCRAPDADGDDHNRAVAAGRSFTTSRFNPAKRLRPRGGSGSSEHDSAIEVLGDLETTIRDVRELVVFLSGCRRLCRQPYSVYLLVDKCMFNRQMEMEQIMEFLLQGEDYSGAPAVLPIIGPGRVGKTTIIEHACNDQRVRSHFSQILRFSQDGLRDVKTIATLGDCSVIKLIHGDDRAVAGGGNQRTLVIIEVAGDIEEGVWEKLYSDCRHHIGRGSKIVVASRSDKIARFGRATQTQSMTVQFFTEEAYWYFFKARTFGSTDMKDHPKVAAIAMDMAREMNGCFFAVSLFGRLLKANFDARVWSMALAQAREFKRMNLLLFGAEVVDLWQVGDPVFVRRANNASSEYFVILDDYQTGSIKEDSTPSGEGPKMSIQDVFFGENNVRPRGRFTVRAYRSYIPPHYSYMMTCEVQRRQRVFSSRKKRIQHVAS